MSDILHSYGKEETKPVNVLAVPKGSKEEVATSSSTVSMEATTGVFAGANFTGANTINIQINKK